MQILFLHSPQKPICPKLLSLRQALLDLVDKHFHITIITMFIIAIVVSKKLYQFLIAVVLHLPVKIFLNK